MFRLFQNIGPGTIVTAAFIGPGTVTVCTLAGVNHGFDLLWAVAVSIISTIVLQEMSARIGLVTRKGLMQNLKDNLSTPWIRYAVIFLVFVAILGGNSAYEAGNIMGGTMGVQNIVGTDENEVVTRIIILGIGLLAFALLYFGKYKTIEKTFFMLVIVMSLTFLLTAIFTRPEPRDILSGLFKPTIPGNGLDVIAIIGTTVVPYNLFLHAALVQEKWQGTPDLPKMRADTYVAVALGGLISMAIIISATSVSGEVRTPTDMAMALEPMLGSWARYFIGTGLFAAGITSAITAPLAAGYVARDMSESGDPEVRFKRTWMAVLVIGIIVGVLGFRPLEIIRVAQIANGLLLPIIAFLLIWLCSQQSIMGSFKNSRWQLALGVLILITTILLGAKAVWNG